MPVPDFQTLMRPLLAVLEDGDDRSIDAIRSTLADQFGLSQQDLEERLPSGRVTTFHNRVGWAATYLYRCKLIERPRRAVYQIADRGREVLSENPSRVDLHVLAAFPEFQEFRQSKSSTREERELPHPQGDEELTPEERMDVANRELRSALAAELLDRVLEQPPAFFEQLVLDVLHAMGYGGSREGSLERLGQSGDEGVDGVIREDQLGLDQIYLQVGAAACTGPGSAA